MAIGVRTARSIAGAWAAERPRPVVGTLVAWAVALVIATSRNGLGVSPDSVGYVAAARSFASNGQFTYWDGTPLSHWPPGLPMILGLLLNIGIDPLISMFIIDVLAVGAYVSLAYLIGRLLLGSSGLAIVLAALTSVALTTVHVYSKVWTEPLFVVLCLVTVWMLTRMIRDGVSASLLLGVAMCVAIACTLRYIGVALLPVVGISLVVAEARQGLPRAVAIGAIGVALSALGAAAVTVRNLTLVGSPTGSWAPSDASLGDLVETTLAIIGRWAVPQARLGSTTAVIVGVAIASLAAYGAFRLVRAREIGLLAVPLLAFVASYLSLLIAGQLTVDGFLDARYLSPVLMPVLLLFIAGASELSRKVAGSRPTAPGSPGDRRRLGALAVGSTAILLMAVYVANNAGASIMFAINSGGSGVGYNSTRVLSSELAHATTGIPGAPGVLSNDPQRVYWVTGRQPIPGAVVLTERGDPAPSVHAQIVAGDLTHYAEFTSPETVQGVSADQLRSWGVVLTDPVTYRDGTLYRMSVDAGT